MDIDQQLRLWLEKSENRERLKKIAYGVIKKCVGQGLSFVLLGETVRMEDVITEDMQKDVTSQLHVFVLENENFRAQMEKFPLNATAISGHSDGDFDLNIGKILVNSFMRDLKDKDRSSPEGNAWRYLYKRIYTILNEEKGRFFMSLDENQKYSVFSMAPKGPIMEEFTEDDMERVPFPDHLVENRCFDGVNQKSAILPLAEYFWKKLAETAGADNVRISVRDFTKWIRFYVPMEEPKTMVGLDCLQEQPMVTTSNPCVEDLEMLHKMVGHIAAPLNEKQKQAFFYHECRQMTLEETAEAMGLKRASNSYYHFEKAKETIKHFIIANNLPGLKPDDLDESVFEVFYNLFCRHLEKSLLGSETRD